MEEGTCVGGFGIHISVYVCLFSHRHFLQAHLSENAMRWNETQQNPWEIDKEVHKQISYEFYGKVQRQAAQCCQTHPLTWIMYVK